LPDAAEVRRQVERTLSAKSQEAKEALASESAKEK
jgi:hypothetical protein